MGKQNNRGAFDGLRKDMRVAFVNHSINIKRHFLTRDSSIIPVFIFSWFPKPWYNRKIAEDTPVRSENVDTYPMSFENGRKRSEDIQISFKIVLDTNSGWCWVFQTESTTSSFPVTVMRRVISQTYYFSTTYDKKLVRLESKCCTNLPVSEW